MSISCTICSELLQASDDAFATPCGHIFHCSCITRWLLGSNTCPYCRKNATQSDLHRIYLCISNNDIVQEDPAALQRRIESLLFEVYVKDKKIRYKKRKVNFFKKLILEDDPLSSQLKQLHEELCNLNRELCISVIEEVKLSTTKSDLNLELCRQRFKYEFEHNKLRKSEMELASCKSRNVELEKEIERLTRRLHGEAVSAEDKIRKTDNNSRIYQTTEDSSHLDSKIASKDNRVITFGPVNQAEFLKQLQIEMRLEMLLESAPQDQKSHIESGYHMITDEDKMGTRFNVPSLFSAVLKEHSQKWPVVGFQKIVNEATK